MGSGNIVLMRLLQIGAKDVTVREAWFSGGDDIENTYIIAYRLNQPRGNAVKKKNKEKKHLYIYITNKIEGIRIRRIIKCML